MPFPADQGTWTFDPYLLTDKDKVRALAGDTNPRAPLISDEAIDFALSCESTIFLAAAMTCEMIAASFAVEVDESVGGVNRSRSTKYRQFMDRAEKLRKAKNLDAIPSIFGGVSETDEDSFDADTDIPKRMFELNQFDHPDTKPGVEDETEE